MKVISSRWLLLFLMLWLPLQGVAAAALTICAQEKGFHSESQSIANDHHHDDCHKPSADDARAWLGFLCDDTSCDAFNHPPIVSIHTIPIVSSNPSIVSSYFSGFVSFIPEQPQRPPLSISI